MANGRMLSCQEIAESFGILVHDFMTVIPVMERATSLAGNVDPWHFQSTDANKSSIASVLYKIITAIEMLKPSIIDYDYRHSHSWTCPSLQIQCPCEAIVKNEEDIKRDHVENCCVVCRKAGWQYHEIDWKIMGLASCWSEVKCLLCNLALPGAPVTSPLWSKNARCGRF